MPNLVQRIEDYLAYRRAAGYELAFQAHVLREFGQHCARTGRSLVRARAAILWAGRNAARQQRIRRLRAIRDFAVYVRAEDERHEVPPADHFGRDQTRRRLPYILSPKETRELLVGARAPRRAGVAALPRVIEVLFGLLACTGLRIGEALALRCDDVTEHGLLVRRDKRGRGRLLPLHPSTERVLQGFLRWRQKAPACGDHLFICAGGGRLTYDHARRAFRRIVDRHGIGVPRGKRRLYIHSLRHTFTVRALQTGPSRREEVGLRMKAVSEYLGHSDLACTYWYYEATPELLADVLEDCENHARF